ncbi:MAG: DUF3987 domain-containing protein [Bdellovibrionota bacterium]
MDDNKMKNRGAEDSLFPWPQPLEPEAFHGLPGELVNLISPHTESDPAALLIQFLVAFGNLAGRNSYYQVESDRHFPNLFAVFVGKTSKGRKGTSLGRIRALFEKIDPAWEKDRVVSGASSGEGIIYAVRDATKTLSEDGSEHIYDPGESDKRLLLIEPEHANVLRQTERDGNILSPTIRNAWDSGNLRTLTRKQPLRATNSHLSFIGHITVDELLRTLSRTERANGFANRFLHVCTKRSKLLPLGGDLEQSQLDSFIPKLKLAIAFAKEERRIEMDPNAQELWRDIYSELSNEQPGMLGALLGRAEPMVLRLALIYCLADSRHTISSEHLKAAIAVWQYCEESVKYIFGASTGDEVADDIYSLLRTNESGITRTDISTYFSHNRTKARVDSAIDLLIQFNLIRATSDETGGRPSTRYFSLRCESAGQVSESVGLRYDAAT